MKQPNAALSQRGEVLELEHKFKVVEIFKSISGESYHSGQVAVFVRLYGCNLRCQYSDGGCDTVYGYEGENYTEMTAVEICKQVFSLSPNKFVVLTGGEPLLDDHAPELIHKLIVEYGFKVDIETNGSINIVKVLDEIIKQDNSYLISTCVLQPNLIFTVDYKSPSSCMNNRMVSNFASMIDIVSRSGYEVNVKCVVSDNDEDIKSVEELLRDMQRTGFNMLHFFLSPVYGCDISYIVDKMCESDILSQARLQLQIHKYIWDPEKRGV